MSLKSQKALLAARGGSISGAQEKNSRQLSLSQFKNHLSHRVVSYNDSPLDVRVIHEKRPNPYTTSHSEQRTFLSLPDTKVDIGGLIKHEDDKYIIYDSNEMDIFPTHYAIKANNVIKIQVGEEKELKGHTSIGQPIYGEKKPIYFERDCYATTNARFNVYTEFDSKINMPEGRLFIFLPYSPDTNLVDGMEFNMFGDRYRIINVDISSVYNDKGITELFVAKIQNEN